MGSRLLSVSVSIAITPFLIAISIYSVNSSRVRITLVFSAYLPKIFRTFVLIASSLNSNGIEEDLIALVITFEASFGLLTFSITFFGEVFLTSNSSPHSEPAILPPTYTTHSLTLLD